MGAQPEGATALPRRVQRRRSAALRPAGVIYPNKPCVAAAQVAVMEHGVGAVGDGDAQVRC